MGDIADDALSVLPYPCADPHAVQDHVVMEPEARARQLSRLLDGQAGLMVYVPHLVCGRLDAATDTGVLHFFEEGVRVKDIDETPFLVLLPHPSLLSGEAFARGG